jgi:phosphatidylinositol alpha-1,6-mannosyltransferase
MKYRFMVFTFKHADRIIANSEFTRDLVVDLGVRPEKVVLNHSGVNIEQFRPDMETTDLKDVFRPDMETGDLKDIIGLADGQKLILSVGRLSRRKGFDHVIRALPALQEQGIDFRYVVIGIGQDREYLESLALREGVAERVHLLGLITAEDLPRWYNLADVFVMPNREINGDTEGFGLVFLEAAACRKPAIAGNAGGTGAALVHEETGLRVDGASVPAIAEALTRVLTDEQYASRLGEAGYDRALAEYSWDRVAERTDAMGRDLMCGQ